MDMPCNCPECNQVVEHNDMVKNPDDWNKLICENCHDRIEEENNSGKTIDSYGNAISWVHDPDDGLMTFFLNSEEITAWSTEVDPEIVFIDFMKTWNMSQDSVTTNDFGDGWYDGFLKAQKLNEDDDCCLEYIKPDEVRNMSEHAESKHAELKVKPVCFANKGDSEENMAADLEYEQQLESHIDKMVHALNLAECLLSGKGTVSPEITKQEVEMSLKQYYSFIRDNSND